jgi:hypothetical protein
MTDVMNLTDGNVMAQVVSHQPLTMEGQVCAWYITCGICAGQSSSGTGFSPSSSLLPCQYHSTVNLHAHISSVGLQFRLGLPT